MTLLETVLSIGVPAVGVIVWAVRIEGRVNAHDEQIRGVREDVHYIRNRIDRAINGHKD